MVSSFKVNTVDQFKEYYAALGQRAVDDHDETLRPLLQKDAPVLVTTTGTRQRTFGRLLWAQVANEANALGLLPKLDAASTGGGFRNVTTRAISSGGGIAEGGAIPATVKPVFQTGSYTWKEYAISFDMSSIQESLARTQEDVITWDSLIAEMTEEVALTMNEDILEDAGTVDSPFNDFESLDRYIASTGEDTGTTDHAGAAFGAGDNDIYGIDRDAGSLFDAYVNHGGVSGTTTDRGLTIARMNTLFTNTYPYRGGSDNKVLLTGWDTWARISEVVQGNAQFAQAFVTRTVNGISTQPGAEGGWSVSTFLGVPIIPTNSMLVDGISEILLVDMETVGLTFTVPPEYLESADYQAIDKFTKEGVFHAIGELTGRRPASCGKLRDLNSS